jgi:hypothetical protein
MRHEKRPTTPFEVGDRVRINAPQTPYHNEETTVISALMFGMLNGRWCWAHIVDIPLPPNQPESAVGIAYCPQHLVPIGDQLERGSWTDIERVIGWNPVRETA